MSDLFWPVPAASLEPFVVFAFAPLVPEVLPVVLPPDATSVPVNPPVCFLLFVFLALCSDKDLLTASWTHFLSTFRALYLS